MKNLIIFLFIHFINFTFSQVKSDTIKKQLYQDHLCVKTSEGKQTSIFDEEDGMVGLDRTKQRFYKRKVYIDSLNNYSGGKLPEFITNKCFDMKGDLWEGIHEYPSLRWNMLKNVNNTFVLKKILNSKDKRLKEVCATTFAENIPFIKKSFYDLTKKRYLELKKKPDSADLQSVPK